VILALQKKFPKSVYLVTFIGFFIFLFKCRWAETLDWGHHRMCSLITECVLLSQNVFSYHRMCSLITECVLLSQNVFCDHGMCSLTSECVHVAELFLYFLLLSQNVFSDHRMCSLITECVLLHLSYRAFPVLLPLRALDRVYLLLHRLRLCRPRGIHTIDAYILYTIHGI